MKMRQIFLSHFHAGSRHRTIQNFSQCLIQTLYDAFRVQRRIELKHLETSVYHRTSYIFTQVVSRKMYDESKNMCSKRIKVASFQMSEQERFGIEINSSIPFHFLS